MSAYKAARIYLESPNPELSIWASEQSTYDIHTNKFNVHYDVSVTYTKLHFDPASQVYWKQNTWTHRLPGLPHNIRTSRDVVEWVSSTIDLFIHEYLLVNADACR